MLLITQATSALASSTTDVNIFPDPFSPAPQHSMPVAKRPKLSLQTSALPSAHYGTAGSNTGNARVADMATATPTTLNTFNNTFDLSIRPSPVSNIASPLIIATTSSAKPTLTTTTTTKPLSSSSSSSSIPRASTKRQTPYELNLPLGVRPILKNSTLPWELRRGSLSSTATAATSSASPLNNSSATTGRRVFFPEPKRVKFAPAEEEVVTKVYVRRHVDISSSSEDEVEEEEASSSGSGSDDGVGSVPVSVADEDGDGDDDQEKSAAVRLSAKTSRNVDEVQRGRSQSRRRASPAGGAVGPRKTRKRRRWEWTLGSNSTEEEEELMAAAASSRGGSVAAVAAEELGSESDSTTTLSSPQLVTPVSNEEVKGALNVAVHEVIPTPTSEGVE